MEMRVEQKRVTESWRDRSIRRLSLLRYSISSCVLQAFPWGHGLWSPDPTPRSGERAHRAAITSYSCNLHSTHYIIQYRSPFWCWPLQGTEVPTHLSNPPLNCTAHFSSETHQGFPECYTAAMWYIHHMCMYIRMYALQGPTVCMAFLSSSNAKIFVKCPFHIVLDICMYKANQLMRWIHT